MDAWEPMRETLREMESADLLRRPVVLDSACGPTVTVDGRELVALCTNDYLSLAGAAEVRAAAVDAVQRWGVGAGASRLISGTTRVHAELEQRLAAFKGAEAAAVTSTGWMANQAAVCTLAGEGDLIVCDKLNHASLLDAARISGATLRTYAHGDAERLRRLLDKHRSRYKRCLIATDSLFSMDGDLAPLAELVEIKRAFDAMLLIDEAHATGVLGATGRGAAELLGVEDGVDATVGTLSKALGAAGGFVAGPQVLVDTIRNTARAYIYTTAPPPAICAAATAALEIVRREPQRRQHLAALSEDMRGRLREAGLDIRGSVSQIIPVVIGSAGEAMRVSRALLDAGFLVPAIRPPTVAPNTSRLRISLAAGHAPDDLHRFVDTLRRTVNAGP